MIKMLTLSFTEMVKSNTWMDAASKENSIVKVCNPLQIILITFIYFLFIRIFFVYSTCEYINTFK